MDKPKRNPHASRLVRLRDRQICQCCYRYCDNPDDEYPIRGEVHHIRPFARGGDNSFENLIYLCRTCHKNAPSDPDSFLGYQRCGGKFMTDVLAAYMQNPASQADIREQFAQGVMPQQIIDELRLIVWHISSELAAEDGL